MTDDTSDRRRDEYPDRAGYPDGTGSLDEGTSAFGGADLSDLEEFAMQDEEDEDENL